jgi:uncharacterized C2H2 Zn-finger protein
MKDFFGRLNYRIQAWMRGRYGSDELSRDLLIVSLVLLVLSYIIDIGIFSTLGFFACLYSLFRTTSKNFDRRRAERDWYLKKAAAPRNTVKAAFLSLRDREHKYIRCPQCNTIMRVPKGKGAIVVTCPGCGRQHRTKS